MKKILTILSVLFVAIVAMAQNKAEIIVSYNERRPIKSGKMSTTEMSLLASVAEAKYYNEITLWILKAEADGGFSFMATGLEHSDRIITPMYLQQDYAKVDRKKALENAEFFVNNEESIMNAQGQNMKIYTLDENGNKVEVPKYDGLKHSLEPDYKMK